MQHAAARPVPLHNRPVLALNLHRLRFEQRNVLAGIDLKLNHGETLALMGPSGAGKTSLLRVIAGLENRFDGTCAVNGRIGMVFQEPTLLPWRSLLDNIKITTQATDEDTLKLLEEVGLAGREHDCPTQLSLGQQRRLSLARAFAVKPDLLLMDEPFVSLDPALVDEMMALFSRLRAAHHVATILVTHVQTEAARLADRTVKLGGQPAGITSDVTHTG